MKKDWNKIYKGEIENDKFRQFSDEELNEILKEFPDAKKILDVGCGRGELLKQLRAKGFDAEGFDSSEVAIKQGGVGEVNDFENYNYQKYDLIFLKFVLAFLEDKKKFIIKLKQHLNKDGGMVIVSPIGEGLDICVNEKEIQEVLKLFKNMKEKILYSENNKKLSRFILK